MRDQQGIEVRFFASSVIARHAAELMVAGVFEHHRSRAWLLNLIQYCPTSKYNVREMLVASAVD